MTRIRIYNSHKGYFSFSSKNLATDINVKTAKVTKYPTKKIRGKNYYGGRLVLPTSIFTPNKMINKRYLLLRLSKTRLVCNLNGILVSKWGYSYLLFIHEPKLADKYLLNFNADWPYVKKSRHTFSKIVKHQRKANGKIYVSARIYVPALLIGKILIILKLIRPLRLKYWDKYTFVLDDETTMPNYRLGDGYVLFYEDLSAKNTSIDYIKRSTQYPVYKLTMRYINEGMSIFEIAETLKIRRTTVWSHICSAFKKQEITAIQLKEILLSKCDAEIRNELIIFLETSRIQEIAEELKSRQTTFRREKTFGFIIEKKSPGTRSGKRLRKILSNENIKYQFKGSIKKIQNVFYKKTNQNLPLNMIEAIVLYLNSISK